MFSVLTRVIALTLATRKCYIHQPTLKVPVVVVTQNIVC
jgi:hypothetical protein